MSGNKARFKDDELDLDLDLVYVTDQLIIMGFPAGGLEGFYRNRREDAKRFLEHRHPNNYWIFNLYVRTRYTDAPCLTLHWPAALLPRTRTTRPFSVDASLDTPSPTISRRFLFCEYIYVVFRRTQRAAVGDSSVGSPRTAGVVIGVIAEGSCSSLQRSAFVLLIA